jgi:broad specificity phosphatase PhoE
MPNALCSKRSFAAERRNDFLPGIKRIMLIRHGESLGNIDERAYATTADWRIPLTNLGREQARLAGRKVASYLNQEVNDEEGSSVTKGKVYFYVSPYLRTRQTLREILREVDEDSIIGIREDPRM